MLRKHSSDSDDVPLDCYKTHSTLHKPDSLPCEFCNHISTSIYENFKHSATHIIIPLVNLTLHQCEDCLHHFTSSEELITHAKLKNHRTAQPPKSEYDIILQSIIKKQLVVKCHDLFNDMKQNGRISQNSTEISKESNPENDSTVSKTKNISDVMVKSEVPTYVISDSDSVDESDVVERSMRKEQRQTKLEVFQTKAEHVNYTLQESVTENLPDATGDQSSVHTVRSEILLQRKWQNSSDSDSHSDVDANIIEHSKMKFYHSDEEIREVDQSGFKYKTLDGNTGLKHESSDDYEPIRSRLVFEDDLDDDLVEEILPDLPCRAIPNRCLLGKTPNTNFKPNSIILGSQTNRITVNNNLFSNGDTADLSNLKILDIGIEDNVLEEYPESVPYETLMQTQICDCRYCGRCFCNRIQLISHEATHLRIRKPRPTLCPYCERFYAGNYRALRKHVETNHPEVDPEGKRPQSQVCKFCHLSYYNFSRHSKYYHRQEQKEVFKKHRHKTMKVCDMCLNWSQNEHLYKQLGSHSEIGTTQKCCKCQNRHFSINLVTRRRLRYHKEEVKSMSNEERLRRIKNKLKMIKRLNKC